MDNLEKFTTIVKKILESQPETRNSDNLLYYRVCVKLNKQVLSLPFGEVLLHLKDYNLPQFETVRRARQKIQHEFKELAGTKNVEKTRHENEKEFREYATS